MNNFIKERFYYLCLPYLRISFSAYLMFFIPLFSSVCCFQKSFGQTETITYARQVIDTLTSPAMDGRGYVDSADWKAADFIRGEMEAQNLLVFNTDYFQVYTLDANVFPGTMDVSLNKTKLIPGKDFLVDAASSSCKGIFKCVLLYHVIRDTNISEIRDLFTVLSKNRYAGKVLMISKDDFSKKQYALWREGIIETRAFGAEGVIEFSENKLTWDASEEQLPFCYLQIKGKIPGKKKSTVTINIESQLKKNYQTRNVIGYVKGTDIPDSFIVFTAHYDHLGQMGKGTYFPGANDNASGSAMVLNLMHYFSWFPLKYSVAFMSFSGEELGLLGSKYYVNHPLFPLDNIKFLVNLDIVGTGDEGIKVVNATEFPKQFDRLLQLNNEKQLVKQVSPRGKAANSDHYSFYEKGVPCFFIYTMGGISAYHDIYDRAETLPLTDYEDLFKLLINFAISFQKQ